MNRAYKYRIYPNSKQQNIIRQTIGCCRYIYNLGLSWKQIAYDADGTKLTYNDLAGALPSLKKFYPWLKDAESTALQQSLRHLDRGFQNFFQKRAGYPKFKSKKHGHLSYTCTMNISLCENKLKLPKIGLVKAEIHRPMEAGYRITSATISMERDDSFYCSLQCEYMNDSDEITSVDSKREQAGRMQYWIDDALLNGQADQLKVAGFDYSSSDFVVDNQGNLIGSPKYYRKALKRQARLQKSLSRKQGSRKGEQESNNHKKQRKRLAKQQRHVANQRKDFLHKRSTEIANRYDIVCVEDLNMRSMSNKSFGNGKATLDNGYGMFLSMLSYKMADRGKYLVKVDKWYPSSQICHTCGSRNPKMKDLRIRDWKCSCCGTEHNRDINAARNIREEGIRILKSMVAKAA